MDPLASFFESVVEVGVVLVECNRVTSAVTATVSTFIEAMHSERRMNNVPV